VLRQSDGRAPRIASWTPLAVPSILNLLLTCLHSTLYQGQNQRGTDVFTWVANTDKTSFAGDISPLLQYLWRNGLVSAGSYLGLVGFGSEAYHSRGHVTFSASGYAIDVLTGPAPTLTVAQLPTVCPTDSESESNLNSSSAAAGRLDGLWILCMSMSGFVGALVYILQ
jgi:hypothetical protein